MVHWSSVLTDIDVQPFSTPYGLTKDLGNIASVNDFFNLFTNDNFLNEIVCNSIAYAHSKGDANFVTTRAEISAFLGLNIYIGIHQLPQISMFWDLDGFIGVEGFKEMIPKNRFFTVSKYLHHSDLNNEDATDLLCKGRPLVNLVSKVSQRLTFQAKTFL